MGLFGKSKKTEQSCCCGDVDSLVIKEGQEEENTVCECGGNCSCGNNEAEQDAPAESGTVIKILGSGCKNCITLAENVKTALDEMNLEAQIIKVTDFGEITRYGVMSTPALVVNEKVVSYGKVLKPQEVVKILEKL